MALIEKMTDDEKKYRITYAKAIISVAFVTVGQLTGNAVLLAVAMSIYLLTLLRAGDYELFPLLLFFLPWSTVLKMSATSISFASVATILLLLKYIFLKRSSISIRLLISFMGIAFLSFFVKIFRGYELTLSYIMLIIMFLAFPYLYEIVREKTNFARCVEFFAVGIISASLTSEIFASNSKIQSYISVFSQKSIGITRLCGFYGDPNFYSAQVVTAFGGVLIILLEKKKERCFDIILSVLLVAVGVISVSKSYFLCTILVLVLWLLVLICYNPSRLIGVTLLVLIVVFVVLQSGAFDDIISQYMTRFGMADDAQSLTTGRSVIWKNYINYLESDMGALLLGQGCTSSVMVIKGSHNTIIQLVYQLGIVGCIILGFWLSCIFRNDQKSETGYKRVLIHLIWIVACFFMWLGLDMFFADDFFLILVLCSLGMDRINNMNLARG